MCLPHRCSVLARARRLDAGNRLGLRLHVPVHVEVRLHQVRLFALHRLLLQVHRVPEMRLLRSSAQHAPVVTAARHVHRLVRMVLRRENGRASVRAVELRVLRLALRQGRTQGTVLVLPRVGRRGRATDRGDRCVRLYFVWSICVFMRSDQGAGHTVDTWASVVLYIEKRTCEAKCAHGVNMERNGNDNRKLTKNRSGNTEITVSENIG